jgi:glucuronosyltransferase
MDMMDSLVRERLTKDFPKFPHLGEIEKMAKLFLINGNHLLDHKEPYYDHIKLVGGAQINDPKPLPEDLQKICDEAKDGFILFSLGTNVRSEHLGNERIQKIIETFRKFPNYRFLWKFEAAEKLANELPNNVFIRPWMPQSDLLAHPNIKLFISHSGLLSIQEAMWNGVPVLGFPVFGDQLQNIIRMSEIGIGKYLDVRKFTTQDLSESIKEILENSRYREKAKEISVAFRDQPQTPLQQATFWAEWVMRNPNINPQSRAALDLSFAARHSYDVIFVSLLGITFIFIILMSLFRKIFKFVTVKAKEKIQ